MKRPSILFIAVCIALGLMTAPACKKDHNDEAISTVTYVEVDYPNEYVEAELPTYEKVTEAEVKPLSFTSGGDAGHFVKLRSDRPYAEVVAHYQQALKEKKGWSVVDEKQRQHHIDGHQIYLLKMIAENGESCKVMVSEDLPRKDVEVSISYFSQ